MRLFQRLPGRWYIMYTDWAIRPERWYTFRIERFIFVCHLRIGNLVLARKATWTM
jgi:hypothetical protein